MLSSANNVKKSCLFCTRYSTFKVLVILTARVSVSGKGSESFVASPNNYRNLTKFCTQYLPPHAMAMQNQNTFSEDKLSENHKHLTLLHNFIRISLQKCQMFMIFR